jgi:hypothetical protein
MGESESALGLETSAGFATQHPVVVPVACESVGALGGTAPGGPQEDQGQKEGKSADGGSGYTKPSAAGGHEVL